MLSSQIQVTEVTNLESVATNILGSDCAVITNVSYSGHSEAFGYFTNGSNVIGLNNGIILSTGKANGVGTINNETGMSTGFELPGDDLLESVAGQMTNDAAVFEFDFVSNLDSVNLTLVFASEEYLEFANSTWNDVFGFFISGGDLSDTVNFALLEGNVPITINSINDVNNSEYYIDNGDGSDTLQSPYPMQFDGFTIPITVSYPITPGESYHLKLAIADGGDYSIDSDVFIQAGSLSASSSNYWVYGENDAHENCQDGSFKVSRLGDISQRDTVILSFLGNGIEGIDYLSDKDTVFFVENEIEQTVTISGLQDNVSDVDSVFLYLGDGNCGPISDFILIKDSTIQLAGRIGGTNGESLSNMNIELLASNLGELTLLESTLTNELGWYELSLIDTSNLIIYIDPANGGVDSTYVPTYSDGSHVFGVESYLNLECGENLHHIDMVELHHSGTGGNISGYIYIQGPGKSLNSFEPAVGVKIFAELGTLVCAYDYTDENGFFSLDPLGDYNFKITVDVFGVDNDLAPMVMASEVMNGDTIGFLLHSDYLERYNLSELMNTSDIEINHIEVSLIPNIVNRGGVVRIESSNLSEPLVEVFSVSGQKITEVKGFLLETKNIPSGIYFVKISDNRQNYSLKKLVIH